MTERPILFNGEMVCAILEGRKTVTRRVVKARPDKSMGKSCVLQPHELAGEVNAGDYRNCPFGQPGDRLWVRETWAVDSQLDCIPPRKLSEGEPIYYSADRAVRVTGCRMIGIGKLRPSIHQPRWACRILLEITAVRVERLQGISLRQVEREGCEVRQFWLFGADAVGRQEIGARVFRRLWESTGGDWQANPWVWVIEFKQVAV